MLLGGVEHVQLGCESGEREEEGVIVHETKPRGLGTLLANMLSKSLNHTEVTAGEVKGRRPELNIQATVSEVSFLAREVVIGLGDDDNQTSLGVAVRVQQGGKQMIQTVDSGSQAEQYLGRLLDVMVGSNVDIYDIGTGFLVRRGRFGTTVQLDPRAHDLLIDGSQGAELGVGIYQMRTHIDAAKVLMREPFGEGKDHVDGINFAGRLGGWHRLGGGGRRSLRLFGGGGVSGSRRRRVMADRGVLFEALEGGIIIAPDAPEEESYRDKGYKGESRPEADGHFGGGNRGRGFLKHEKANRTGEKKEKPRGGLVIQQASKQAGRQAGRQASRQAVQMADGWRKQVERRKRGAFLFLFISP